MRVRTVPLPWQTSCLCQVLEVLSFSPSAQSYSGGSAPACWDRRNINKIKRIQDVFYKLLGILCVKLGGRGDFWQKIPRIPLPPIAVGAVRAVVSCILPRLW